MTTPVSTPSGKPEPAGEANTQDVPFIDRNTRLRRNNKDTILSLAGIRYADKAQVEDAIALIRDTPELTVINLRDVNMPSQWMAQLLEAAAQCPNLERLTLDGNPLEGKAAEALLDALPKWRGLQEITLGNCRLDTADIPRICEALQDKPQLQQLELRNNPVSDSGVQAVAQLLRAQASLRILGMQSTSLNDSHLPELADAISTHDSLVTCELHFNNFSKEAMQEFAVTLRNNHNRNLISPPLHNPLVEQQCKNNFKKTSELLKTVSDQPVEELAPSTLAAIAARMPSMQRHHLHKSRLQNLRELMGGLPVITPQEATPETLTQADARGYTPLDNPHIWENIRSIATAMAEKDTALTCDLLMQPNRSGEPYLMAALLGRPEQSIPALNAAGVRIQAEVLLTETGEPSPLLTQMIDDETAPLLFTRANFRGESSRAIAAAYNQLPDDLRNRIGNYHSLVATARSSHAIGR